MPAVGTDEDMKRGRGSSVCVCVCVCVMVPYGMEESRTRIKHSWEEVRHLTAPPTGRGRGRRREEGEEKKEKVKSVLKDGIAWES